MKRFHCNICGTTKRVRRLPDSVRPIIDALGKVEGYTAGHCRWHNRGDGVSRAALNNRVRVLHTPRHKAASTPAVQPKSKGWRRA